MIDPKQALADAETHIEAPGAVQVWLTTAMIAHWQADALETAAKVHSLAFGEMASKFVEAQEYLDDLRHGRIKEQP